MKKFFLLFIFCLNLFANERIITLAPSINEIVFALDLEDKIVANTEFCDYPQSSQKKEKIGNFASISLEKIIKLKPTVVIGQNYNKRLITKLNNLGIKTLDYKTNSIEDIKNTIADLGKYFYKEKKATKLIKKIDDELNSLKNIVQDKKVLIVIGASKRLNSQIYITGNHLYFEDIIKTSKNKNAFYSKNISQPIINLEKVISLNPDIIILLAPSYENDEKTLNEIKNLWYKLPIKASKLKNIYAINKQYASIPSHRIVYFIKDFNDILQKVKTNNIR